jgi:uncharacterized protein YutE (UPF0331/DUF86 family)
MSEDQAELLETLVKRRILDAQRHLEALRHAASGMGADFDLAVLEAAWASSDPQELNRAYAIQAGYENLINACVKVAEEVCRLESWSDRDVTPSSVEALRLLHEHGVITAKTRSEVKAAQELRSKVQHDYVNVAARDLHEAAQTLMVHAPDLLQDVAFYLKQRT